MKSSARHTKGNSFSVKKRKRARFEQIEKNKKAREKKDNER